MKNKLVFIILLSTILWTCRKEFIIDYPPLPAKLVVNCLFTPDSVFNIQVSKLQYVNDTTDATIKNAEVIIYENDVFFETVLFNSESKTYKSVKKPRPGRTYFLAVEAEGFPKAVAEDKVPDTLSIDSANVYISAYYDSWEERKLDKVELYFKNTSEENYYEIISYTDYNYDSTFHTYSFPYGITSIDPVILNEGILDQTKYLPVLSFSDKLLNENAQITFMPFLQLGTQPNFTPDSYTILRNISKEYYLFRKKWYKYLQTHSLVQMDGIAQLANMSFVADPTEVYTNIENGLGIFAAYTETTKLMNLRQ